LYTLKNPESDFKKGLVKDHKKVRFSIYVPKPTRSFLDEVAEEEGLDSRNKAVVKIIEHYRENGSNSDE